MKMGFILPITVACSGFLKEYALSEQLLASNCLVMASQHSAGMVLPEVVLFFFVRIARPFLVIVGANVRR